jgi:cellulose synthase/poly-beta-1,6-N-acetylglucosamine synthase-like glycosyltransferase
MTGFVSDVLVAFDWFVLIYFLVLNLSYLALIGLAVVGVTRSMRRAAFAGQEDVFANPLTPGVSVVAAAYNEELDIVDSVHSMLALRYPLLEVIVVDDGSTDATFERLREAFDLTPSRRAIPSEVPTLGRVLSTHAAGGGVPLLVVCKENTGRKTDPINVGINAARHPLVCLTDGDSVLEERSLLKVAQPFVDDPERVVATGGVIRPINGSTVEQGLVSDVRMPRGWVARIQVVEYLRSFLLSRSGWSHLGGLPIISGAFGLFRRDLLVEVGGLDLDTVGEDAELVIRIHATMRREERDQRVVFVPEPVCWTEVPEGLRVLARQRRRWSLGMAEVLWKHRRMMGNPRNRVMGLLTLPHYLFFELLGPVVELTGLVAVAAGLALGLIDVWFAVLVAVAAIGAGLLLSIAAIATEEYSFRRHGRWRDLGVALTASVVELLGYRQLVAFWRLQGLADFLMRRRSKWGTMRRVGFGTSPGPIPGRRGG